MCIWWSMYHATPEALDGTLVKCTDCSAPGMHAYDSSRVRGAGKKPRIALRSCVLLAQGYLETLDLQYKYFMVEGAHFSMHLRIKIGTT